MLTLFSDNKTTSWNCTINQKSESEFLNGWMDWIEQ